MGVTAPSNLTVSGSRSTSFRPAEPIPQIGRLVSLLKVKTASAKRVYLPLSHLRCPCFLIARAAVLSHAI